MSALGLATDYTLLQQKRSALQAAVDAAAIAAGKELTLVNADTKTLKSLAQTYVFQNFAGEANEKTTKIDVKVGSKRRNVKVSLSHHWEPFLLQYVGRNVLPIRVDATAQLAGSGKICMIAFGQKNVDDDERSGIRLKKNAQMVGEACGVYSNAKRNDAIRVEKNAVLKSGLTCSAGGVKKFQSSNMIPQPVTNCPAVKDPLADRQPPPVGKCDFKDVVISKGVHTLNPGTYCEGLRIRKTAQVTLNPGIYVMKEGMLEVTDDATMEGEGVGFFFADEDSKLSFRRRTTISLTAPKTGPMAGILMFEKRSKDEDKLQHRLTSDNARMLLGTIYLPNGSLRIDSNGPVADQSAYTAIIADSIILDEGPTLHLNSDYEATDVPVPDGLAGTNIRLVN